MTELEVRVIAAVAKERRMQPSQITLDSRLYHDLGMYGDDADEFLEMFSRELSVDLTLLFAGWGRYFKPESSLDFRMVMAALGVAAATFLLARRFPAVPEWAWFLLLGAPALAAFRPWGVRDKEKYLPLTVQDLIDAAKAGRWSKPMA